MSLKYGDKQEFEPFNSNSSSYFHDYILKFCNIRIVLTVFTFSVLSEGFKLISECRVHNTKSSSKGLLFVPS